MRRLTVFALVGFAAQLVDGSLGMAYGVTSATLLLAMGTAPALVSASVHLAEIGTTLMSGAAHWRFGNVDWRTVRWMAFPGALGAFAGALALSAMPADRAKPIVAAGLFALGVWILVRFGRRNPIAETSTPLRPRDLASLGLVAGFLDAVGGGGWGPVSTPTLVASGRIEPRRAVGSVDTGEFLVALAASAGFLLSLGTAGIDAGAVLALLVAGLVAAPIAAYLVRVMHPRVLGTGVGAMILVTNARTLLDVLDARPPAEAITYATLALVVFVSISVSIARIRGDRTTQPQTASVV